MTGTELGSSEAPARSATEARWESGLKRGRQRGHEEDLRVTRRRALCHVTDTHHFRLGLGRHRKLDGSALHWHLLSLALKHMSLASPEHEWS